MRKVLLILFFSVLCGCSAMFIPSTRDPYKKLTQAHNLVEMNRPLPAERLAIEALKEFQTNNDQWGMGQAYGELGVLYQSPAVKVWENYYRKDGFLEESVAFENRFTKSLEYFKRAEEIFQRLKAFDALTRMRLYMAELHQQLGHTEEACSSYQQALLSHNKFISEHPEAKEILPSDFSSFEELVSSKTKTLGCKH